MSSRDSLAKFWHHAFGRPVRMKVGLERPVKNPELTVVFLHGIAAESHTFKTTMRQLAHDKSFANVRLVALDLLGFGKSPKYKWLDYDYMDYDGALTATLRKLKVRCPVILVGHSMGALIATDYAKRHPREVARVVLVSPPVLLAEEMAKAPDLMYFNTYRKLHYVAKEPAVQSLAKFIERFSNFRAKYLKGDAFAKSMDRIILNPHNFDSLIHLKVPGLLIHGRIDPLVYGPNLRLAAKQNSQYLRIKVVTAHHEVTATKRKLIADEIAAELAERRKNAIV